MDHVSELRGSLNDYFHWNNARMSGFVNMLVALISILTANLNKLAGVIS